MIRILATLACLPRSALLTVLLLMCAGCARFANPIVSESGPRFDDGLAGYWFAENEDGKFEMVIVRNGDEGRIVTTETQTGKEPESDKFRLVTARLEQQTFASIASLREDANWILFRYELVPPDRLIVYQDDDNFWDEAVRNRLIPGDADAAGKERNSKVTASREEMRDFVVGYGSVIFKDVPAAELRRLPSN